MHATVLINNYNYGSFLAECISSVLNQTYRDIEIIVVDDGSTDESLAILESFSDDRLSFIAKENGGQLSAFNEGIKAAQGDIVFFLDSDDKFELDYIQKAIDFYADKKDCNFLYVATKLFGATEGNVSPAQNGSSGYSFFSALYKRKWVGNVTSSISVKRSLLTRLFPLEEIESDWITRADDCLIWGTSILGAKKYCLDEPLVLYRIHQSNNFHGKKFDIDYNYRREFSIMRFFGLCKSKLKVTDIPKMFIVEYFSQPFSRERFYEYFSILMLSNIPRLNKPRLLMNMLLNKKPSFD